MHIAIKYRDPSYLLTLSSSDSDYSIREKLVNIVPKKGFMIFSLFLFKFVVEDESTESMEEDEINQLVS